MGSRLDLFPGKQFPAVVPHLRAADPAPSRVWRLLESLELEDKWERAEEGGEHPCGLLSLARVDVEELLMEWDLEQGGAVDREGMVVACLPGVRP